MATHHVASCRDDINLRFRCLWVSLTMSKVPNSRQSQITRWVTRLLYSLSILGLIYAFRLSLMTGLAETWVVRNQLARADAIVVLGGGMDTRTFQAAGLYHDGYARHVLVTNVELTPADLAGVTVPETRLEREVLVKKGVPDEAIVTVGNAVSSTYEEALAVKEWSQQNGARRLIVPTEIFHSRRVNWVFHKVLEGTGVDVCTYVFESLKYNTADWWRHEEGRVDFQNEVLKLGYYVIKY